jgi:hypothetical protein
MGLQRCHRVIANALGWMEAEQARHIGRMHAEQLVCPGSTPTALRHPFVLLSHHYVMQLTKRCIDYPD